MSTEALQFWFEFASTYSYLSASRIARLAADIEWNWFRQQRVPS